MRIVCISDTHGEHRRLRLPEGDILVHAGDFSKKGEILEAADFSNWLAEISPNYRTVCFVAGNHDLCMVNQNREMILNIFSSLPNNVHYLENNKVEVEGLKIWGSPQSANFEAARYCRAFFAERGAEIRWYWDIIDDDVDILITHGPPMNILDRTMDGENAGCFDLFYRLDKLKQLKLHVFGHIHEGYGECGRCVNASIMDEDYDPYNLPIVKEIM